MADENDTGASTEVVATDTPATTPAPKKQRAPRREKVAAEVAVPTDTVVKSKRVYRKKSDLIAAEAKPAAVETPVKAKGITKLPAKSKAAPAPEKKSAAPVAALDDIADLIQLEEENKKLRKSLADKLRAENADLRKRLGL